MAEKFVIAIGDLRFAHRMWQWRVPWDDVLELIGALTVLRWLWPHAALLWPVWRGLGLFLLCLAVVVASLAVASRGWWRDGSGEQKGE